MLIHFFILIIAAPKRAVASLSPALPHATCLDWPLRKETSPLECWYLDFLLVYDTLYMYPLLLYILFSTLFE